MASDDPGDPRDNPYAPPRAEPAPAATPALEKARRVNMINRRTAALLFEMAAYWSTVGVALTYLLARYGGDSGVLLVALVGVPFYLLRDVLGPCSFGKRLLGLRLVASGDGALPASGSRVLRNLLLLLPVLPVVEYFVAYYGNAAMQRLGDRWAGTRVEDVDPQRYGRSSYSGTLLLAFISLGAAYYLVTSVVGDG